MALEDLLARLHAESGTRGTPAVPPAVPLKSSPALRWTPGTHGTLQETTDEAELSEEAPLPLTMEYFRAQRVELLPEDLAFLRWYLPRAAPSRNDAIGRYIDTWLMAAAAEPVLHRKENAGRYAANSWLRALANEQNDGSLERNRPKMSGVLK